MNFADRLVSWFDPVAGMRRHHARKVLAYYEAAKSDRLRKSRREAGSGNDAVLRAGSALYQQARHFEQNYDLALGVLNTLVANIVGPNGIGVEPQPRRADGSIDDAMARQILDLYKDWSRRPEVTWQHDWPSAQRILCRSWMRDGEVFGQMVAGIAPWIEHGTRVPLSIEMLEADYVPIGLQSTAPLIVQGVEINAWGRPVGYHVYKTNPLETASLSSPGKTKRISSSDMLHLANRHRIRQLRGVSVFASVLQRFDDLKDYEESERIAAKIAASMAAFIKKGTPDMYDPESDGTPRGMKFRPGMIFDDLKPGEEIGTIDTKRPNANLEAYRNSQLKAVAAGAGPTYSSISRTYDGTYSAQRQELVEGWNIYGTLANEFIGRVVRPVYERFIAVAIASGQLKVPAGILRETLDDAVYLAPQMPWIDPSKEADAFATLEANVYASGPEIIRRRGGNPVDVLEQQARWKREKEARGLDAKQEPAAAKPSDDNQPVAVALGGLAAAVQATASREQAAPVNHFHLAAPEVHNHLPGQAAPSVEVNVEAIMPEQQAPAVDVHVEAIMPDQPAPVVNVENHVAPAAVTVENTVQAAPISKVEITAMPTRETTSTIERDGSGQIVKSTQVESDAEK